MVWNGEYCAFVIDYLAIWFNGISTPVGYLLPNPVIYIYIVLFGPVKPELGVIPPGQKNIQQWTFKILFNF